MSDIVSLLSVIDVHEPSSQIVSKSKSPLRSAPQTLHLFLLSLPILPVLSELKLNLLPAPSSFCSSLSAAAFNIAIFSASSSASGESGIVSSEEILGDLERIDVGVEGIEGEEREYDDG